MKKNMILQGIIFLLLSFILYNFITFISIKTSLEKLPPDKILYTLSNAVNKHDTKTINQVLIRKDAFNNMKSMNILNIEKFDGINTNIDGKYYAEISYKVKLEIYMDTNGQDISINNSTYNWIFTLIQKKDKGQWYILNYGY